MKPSTDQVHLHPYEDSTFQGPQEGKVRNSQSSNLEGQLIQGSPEHFKYY